MSPTQDSRFTTQHLLAQAPAVGFDCGDCTACCTVLAVTELRKPMRYACEHLCRDGCRVYTERPEGCRKFNCLWLRGALNSEPKSLDETSGGSLRRTQPLADPALRPDHLGVIWDYFLDGASRTPCLVAFEVWTGAFLRPDVLKFLTEVCETAPLRLSFRNGHWAEAASAVELSEILRPE